MKKLSILFGGTLFFAIILSITAFRHVPPNGPSANGQGGLLLPYMNGQVQQFSFHANTDKDGNVSGSWESNSPGQNCRTHGDITCLTILADGKTALMSGVITQVDGGCFGAVVGSTIWFKVKDNGEGSNAANDRFTDYYFGISGCVNYGGTLHQIVNGNIQVKP